jgi:hypothetical protein
MELLETIDKALRQDTFYNSNTLTERTAHTIIDMKHRGSALALIKTPTEVSLTYEAVGRGLKARV